MKRKYYTPKMKIDIFDGNISTAAEVSAVQTNQQSATLWIQEKTESKGIELKGIIDFTL